MLLPRVAYDKIVLCTGLQSYLSALLKVLNAADAVANSGGGRSSAVSCEQPCRKKFEYVHVIGYFCPQQPKASTAAANKQLQSVIEEFDFLLGVQVWMSATQLFHAFSESQAHTC